MGYGIHGTPNPDEISKTAPHGCIHLTNWDALALAQLVRKGMPGYFLNENAPRRSANSAAGAGLRTRPTERASGAPSSLC